MTLYIVSAVLFLFVGMASNANRHRKAYMILVFTVLTVLFGMRDYSVGADTLTYCNQYIVIGQSSVHEVIYNNRFEVGFSLMCKALNCITDNPRILLWTAGCIINGSICRFIYKYSMDVSLSVYLWIMLCFGDSVNIMRGYLAFAIVLFGFDCFVQNKKVACVIYICLAMCFHTVAVAAFLPIILFSVFKKVDFRRAIFYILLISACAIIFFSPILSIVLTVFPQYTYYLSSVWGQQNYIGPLINVIPSLSLLALGAAYSEKKDNIKQCDIIKETVSGILFWQIACALIFSIVTMRMTAFNRVTALFYPYIMVWVPIVLNKIKKNSERKLWWLIILIMTMAIFVVVSVFRPEWNNSVPYKFFWAA